MGEDIRIEYPSRGTTYKRNKYGVYKYDRYPRHSVLSGQQRRIFVNSFDTLDEAKKEFPNAKVEIEGVSGFQPPDLSHLPKDDDY